MTLNQVVKRVEEIVVNHKQINQFYYGHLWEFLAKEDAKYPACILENKNGSISRQDKLTTLNFTVYFLDLVNVSEDTEGNETEVLSDLLSVSEDFISMLYSPQYSEDWFINNVSTFDLYTEKIEDMTAGVGLNIQIATIYDVDRCKVPTNLKFEEDNNKIMVHKYIYIATGGETSFTIPSLIGKKILLFIRQTDTLIPIEEKGTNEDSVCYEYIAATGQFNLFSELQTGEVEQLIWRNI